MDSTRPPTALTALHTNVVSPTAKPPSSTPSRPLNGGNGSTGGNQNKYNNKNHNSGNGDGNNDKNSNGGGGRGGSSGQTTASTGSDGRTNAPWTTYGHLWQGHMTMYPSPCPLDSSVRRPSWPHWTSTRLPASCPGHSSNSRRRTSRPLRPQDGTPDSAQAGTSSHWPTPSAPRCSTRPLPRSRTMWRTPTRCTTPLH
jgi:hypothetical protein